MVNIDLKDRKILYQLDIDSRQSYRVIAKKVGLSKDGVSNRIARMQEKGIIKNFYTVVDTSPLGYIHPRFYIKYQYTNPEIKKEIIYHFVKSKYVGFVHELEGNYELAVAMVVKNITEFSNFWEKSMAKYRNYFANQSFSIYLSENMYRYSFLFDENATERFDTTNVQVFGGIKQVKIDELECNILKLITPDARMPLTIIAKKINSTTRWTQSFHSRKISS